MIDVRDAEVGDLQRAARTLLVHGLVTASRPNERAYRNVRRYAEPLEAALSELAGYRIAVTPTAVRLVRRLDRLAATPVFHTPSGRPFDPTRYALVALTLAALERSGSQTTLTDLARRIRRAAERTPGLVFDPDIHASRLALGHAVRVLEVLGALSLTDGSREAWEQGQDDAEALYDIDRLLCRQVFPLACGLRQEASAVFLHADPEDVGRDPQRRQRRQRLARRLLEEPVVYFDDLVDPGRRLSDRPFPSGGSDQQAALLLATRPCALRDELPRAEAPHAAEPSDLLATAIAAAAPEPDPPAPPVRPRTARPFVDEATLTAEATRLRDEMGPALKSAYRDDPTALLHDALAALIAYDLVRPVPGGVVLMPAIARFREVEVEASEELKAQLGLFGGAP